MASWFSWSKKKSPEAAPAKSALLDAQLEHELDIERGRFERMVALLTADGAAAPDVGQPTTIEEFRAARVRLAMHDARAAGLEAAAEVERLAAEIDKPRERVVLLMGLCNLHARTGDTVALRRLLEQVTALFRAGDFDPSSLAHYLGGTSSTHASEVERSNAAEITRCAEQIVAACPDPDRRVAALTELVSARVQAGDFDGARAWLERIDDDYWNWDARAALVEAQCQAGDIASAQATAEPIRDKAIRDRVNKSLAVAWAREGENESALAAVELVRDETLREDAALDVALARAQRGDDEHARELIESLEDDAQRWNALAQIALGHMERGEREIALEIASEIEDDEWRGTSHNEFVGVLLAQSKFDDALQVAEAIEHPNSRGRALRQVAEHVPSTARDDKTRLLEAALNAAALDRSETAAARNANFIASILTELGKLDSACDVAEAVRSADVHNEILLTIASTLAATNQVTGLEDLLGRYRQPVDRARILIAAAGRLITRARRAESAPAQAP